MKLTVYGNIKEKKKKRRRSDLGYACKAGETTHGTPSQGLCLSVWLTDRHRLRTGNGLDPQIESRTRRSYFELQG